MKIGIIVYSNDSETVWNAFRFANFSLNEGDEIKVFLLGKGVECESLDTNKFKVTEQMQTLVDNGGKIFACGSCLEIRQSEDSEVCPLSAMKDLYEIVKKLHFERTAKICSLRSLVYNTVYAVRFAHPNSAFGGTSHTPKTLSEILLDGRKEEITYICNNQLENPL